MGELDLCRVRGGYQTSRQGVHQAGPASTPLGGDHGAQCSRVALVQRGGGGGGGDRHRGLPNSSEAVNYVLEHSRADILVVGDSENLAKLSDTGTKLAAADKYALQGSLIETLVEAQPTRFIGVPRVYEKIADKLQEVAAKGGRLQKAVSSWAKEAALEEHRARMRGEKGGSLAFLSAQRSVSVYIKIFSVSSGISHLYIVHNLFQI